MNIFVFNEIGAMKKNTTTNRKPKKRGLRNFAILLIILVVFAGIPLLILNYQSHKTGMSVGNVVSRKINRNSDNNSFEKELLTNNQKGGKFDFLVPKAIGEKFTDKPQISNIFVADLDNDGLTDVLVCDTKKNFVSWIRQDPAGIYTEHILAGGLIAPAHIVAMDFDNDGDKDILVAVLGMLFPSNDKIGSVVILENDGKCEFKKHVIVEKIARVSDVRGADLDGDGDIDLAAAQFGYDDGQTRWIENLGNWKFKNHILQNLSGPINVEIVDVDKDGDSDIISLVSQEWEEIYCFINDGKGNFQPKLLWGSTNEDFGSSNIYMYDLDKDGDQDILYTNGDAFDYIPPVPRPWHGVNWLENTGGINFTFHRIGNFAGAYSARPADIDNDNDIDLFVVSGFNFWEKSESQSFIWLENDGKQNFTLYNIANTPTHLLTLESGDFNNDGLTDFVTGGMHTYPPYDHMSRILLWLNNGALNTKK
jgi:hypothetical protein